MSSFTEHPRNAYLPIGQFPQYQNFSYQFDYVTIVTIFSFMFFVPSMYAFIRMCIFYEKNVTKNFSKEIHPFVFKAFIYMQGCNHIYTVLDIFLYRIPSTSIVTSYFSTMKSDSFIRYVVAALYGFQYLSQLFTVLFCFIRVLILYNPRKHLEVCDVIFLLWSISSYVSSFVAAIPHVMSDAMGLQLDIPFQYGSMFLTTTFAYGNGVQTIANFLFSLLVTVSIVVMTSMMVSKLRSMKLMTRNSNRKTKAEATLTITMFVILIPAVFIVLLSISSIFIQEIAGYLILIRPILLDFRINIVSCYFYWTHPYFKKNQISQSVTVRSLSSTAHPGTN